MKELIPLETLFEEARGEALPLSGELARVVGSLKLQANPAHPYIIGNFVTTLDGVVALNAPGHTSGGDISGFNPHDQVVMGLLRAAADAVVVGAGTFRVMGTHTLTPGDIAPAFAEDYQQLRASLGKTGEPLNVIVTARGDLNLDLPLFQEGRVPVLVITTGQGLLQLKRQNWPGDLQVETVRDNGAIRATSILKVVSRVCRGRLLLVEGGPRLLSEFIAARSLDELFLTLAPQIAGRAGSVERPGIVAGQLFAPEDQRWGSLVGVRRAVNHLFLRYEFERTEK